jgi:hypothetical protein
MVGIPGTEERLALAEIEDRLRRVRARFNLYTFQHHLYRLGPALSLGIALLILGAFLLPPWGFTLAAWPALALLAFLTLFFLRRSVVDWSDVTTSARRIDTTVGLKERLSTLVAQLTAGVIGKEPPSSLWPQLLADNLSHLSDWEVKKVAPRRIPWSFFPFLAALVVALFIASVPMLSSVYRPDPFSLDNLQNVLPELPDRLGKMADERLSMLPDAPEHWGDSSLFEDKQAPNSQKGETQQLEKETDQPGARSLASLPEELQKKIREALKGLDLKEEEKHDPGNVPPDDKRLALRPSDAPAQKKSDSPMQGKTPKGKEQQAVGSGNGQGNEGKGNGSALENGGAAQSLAQGSGIQQLDRARLDRKNARGQFQPDNGQAPQAPGRGGESGEGGPGAGSGTDPHLLGNQVELGSGSRSFQLALDATHERISGENTPETPEKDEGGIIEKSTKNLNQRQSFDDAIRKSQVPPEYEEIVKHLFSRGESP